MIQHFTSHTINCLCYSIRSMFIVLGICDFEYGLKCYKIIHTHIIYLIYLVASQKANNLLVFFVVPFVAILLYTYYHGIIDHSGITFKRHWWQPWQPDCIFHDNHHQYFHVNFGFNIELWDKVSAQCSVCIVIFRS